MSTDLQRQKYGKLFDQLDADSSGTIEETDIDAFVQFWCRSFSVQPGSSEHKRINGYVQRMWQDLILRNIDADGNKQVSRDEWDAAFEQPNFINNVAIPLAIFYFDIGDTDNDGQLTQEEFIVVQRISSAPDEEIREMFNRLDADADGYITRAEYIKAVEGDPLEALPIFSKN